MSGLMLGGLVSSEVLFGKGLMSWHQQTELTKNELNTSRNPCVPQSSFLKSDPTVVCCVCV